MMDVERGQLLFSGRGFRTLGQLILEWIVGLIAVFSLFMAVFNPLMLLVALAFGYLLYRLLTGWHRKRVEVWSGGIVVGREFIPWSSVEGLDVGRDRVEAGLILGQTILTYEHVVEAVIRLADRHLKIRLKSSDSERFARAVEQARQGRQPEP